MYVAALIFSEIFVTAKDVLLRKAFLVIADFRLQIVKFLNAPVVQQD